MGLISEVDVGSVERVRSAGRSFNSVIRVVSRVFKCFEYRYVAYILVCFYLAWFVCMLLWFTE